MAIDEELIIAIRAEVKDAVDKLNQVKQAGSKLGEDMKKLGANMTKYVTLPLLAIGALSLREFGKSAEASARFTAALKISGREGEMTTKAMAEFASSLEKVTTFEDDATLAAMAMMEQIAGLSEQELKKVTPLLQDMAQTLGLDLNEAALAVSKTLEGGRNMLKPYGIELDENASKSEKLAKITEWMNSKFAGTAQALAKEGLGPLKQLQNSLGNVAEEIGKAIVPAINSIIGVIKPMLENFNKLDDGTKSMIVTVGGIVAVSGPVISALAAIGTASTAALGPIGLIAAGAAGLVMAGNAMKGVMDKAFTEDNARMLKQFMDQGMSGRQAWGEWALMMVRSGKSAEDFTKEIEAMTKANPELAKSFNTVQVEIQAALQKAGVYVDFSKKVQKETGVVLDIYDEMAKEINDKVDKERDALHRQNEYWGTSADRVKKEMDVVRAAIDEMLDKKFNPQGENIPKLRAELDRLTEAYNKLAEAEKKAGAGESDAVKMRKEAIKAVRDKVNAVQDAGNKQGDSAFITEWKKNKDDLEKVVSNIQAVMSPLEGLTSQIFSNQLQDVENWYKTQKDAIEASVDDEKTKKDKLEKLDKQYAEKRKPILKAQFEANKASSLIQAGINTAVAVTKALSEGLIPLAIAVGALGAFQIAAIAAAPTPEFAQGGQFITSGRQNITVGDNAGGRELVQVTPLSSSGLDSPGGASAPVIIQIDSKPIYQGLLKATRNRIALIDGRALV